jgi:hypothetical protein
MNPFFSSARRSAASSLCATSISPFQLDSQVNVQWLDSRNGEIASNFQTVRPSSLVSNILFTLLYQRIALDLPRHILQPLRIQSAGLLSFGDGHPISGENGRRKPSASWESVHQLMVNPAGQRGFEPFLNLRSKSSPKLTSKSKNGEVSNSSGSNPLADNSLQLLPRRESNSYGRSRRSSKSRNVPCNYSILVPSIPDRTLTGKVKHLHRNTSPRVQVQSQNHESNCDNQYTSFHGAPSPTPRHHESPEPSERVFALPRSGPVLQMFEDLPLAMFPDPDDDEPCPGIGNRVPCLYESYERPDSPRPPHPFAPSGLAKLTRKEYIENARSLEKSESQLLEDVEILTKEEQGFFREYVLVLEQLEEERKAGRKMLKWIQKNTGPCWMEQFFSRLTRKVQDNREGRAKDYLELFADDDEITDDASTDVYDESRSPMSRASSFITSVGMNGTIPQNLDPSPTSPADQDQDACDDIYQYKRGRLERSRYGKQYNMGHPVRRLSFFLCRQPSNAKIPFAEVEGRQELMGCERGKANLESRK